MRYIRIYMIFLKQYLKILMEYRSDFLIGMLSFLIVQSSNLVFLTLIFQRIPSLSGWSFNEVLFIYGFSQIPRGIDHLFTDNLWLLANRMVRFGEFDKYLLRPINPLFHLIAERFQPDAFGEIIVGVSIFTYAYKAMALSFTLGQWFLFAVAIIVGVVIYTSIKLAAGSIALWTKRSQHVLFIIYQLSEFASYPVTIFSTVIRMILMFVVPFAFVAFVPGSILLDKTYLSHGIWIGGLVAMIMWTISYQFIWKKGLKAYESTGS